MNAFKPLMICGDSLKKRCGTVCDFTDCSTFDVEGLDITQAVSFYQKEDNGIVFCNPLYLDHVNSQMDLSNQVLITHNTDSSLVSYVDGVATFSYLNGQIWSVSNLYPKVWLAQNSLDPKVISLPLGVTNNDIMDYEPTNDIKELLVYKNFGISNNPPERSLCDRMVNIPNQYNNSTNRESYYKDLDRSYFAVSPDGYGIDCHRHWEALYFNCIPIVTRNQCTEHFSKNFPMVLVDSWNDFRLDDYNVELYQKLISTFDRKFLDIDHFINHHINGLHNN